MLAGKLNCVSLLLLWLDACLLLLLVEFHIYCCCFVGAAGRYQTG